MSGLGVRGIGWQDAESRYGDDLESREPGARRKKIAGYLKAANELRQNYQQNWRDSRNARDAENEGLEGIPGSYPTTSRNGEDELVLFPTYARRHVRRKPSAPKSTNQPNKPQNRDYKQAGSTDANFWRQEWDKYEDDNAIVDVDVRGWLFSPHRGPLTRKNKILIGLARQLAGLPSPGKSPSASASNSRSSSPYGIKEKVEKHNARQEEEIALREAESIVKRGENEAKMAHRGAYSENPNESSEPSSATSGSTSRTNSPIRHQHTRSSSRPSNQRAPPSSLHSTASSSTDKRSSMNDPSQMSSAELQTANMHLMTRLQPFMANPIVSTPISAFFYNDKNSRSKTVDTDTSGHFFIRAALDFIPSHVRILASEKLSATEEVQITEPRGISIISDIDDTIKHSAIGSGAKEIFKNVFVRELNRLSIKGVNEWYHKMQQMGVMFHYVSNSPWQLYPVLNKFFAQAGLPPGSFHLKQYSGMLQGIFEPVAERKKSTLEQLMGDFPDRQFLLVGDSGEADLEVYTEVVRENPGRILGVFIRDVTTSVKKEFFDPAMGPLSGETYANRPREVRHSQSTSSFNKQMIPDAEDEPEIREAIKRSIADYERQEDQRSAYMPNSPEGDRPPLPARRGTAPVGHVEEDLIDLSDNSDAASTTTKRMDDDSKSLGSDFLQPPPRPRKPRRLSSAPTTGDWGINSASSSIKREKTPPPRPRKPSSSVQVNASPAGKQASAAPSLGTQPENNTPPSSTSAQGKPPRPDRKPADLPSRSSSLKSTPRQQQTLGDLTEKPPKPPKPEPPPPRGGYSASARQKLSSAYNRLPSPTSIVFGQQQQQQGQPLTDRNTSTASPSGSQSGPSSRPSSSSGGGGSGVGSNRSNHEDRTPPKPPRKPATMHNYTGSTGSTASTVTPDDYYPDNDKYGGYGNSGSSSSAAYGYGTSTAYGAAVVNKKEELWRRRWAEAKMVLEKRGVMLRSWRVGGDVEDDAVRLVERKAQEEGRREGVWYETR
ncbi:MAG: hypothetical protein M1831_003106 [Alyxoria varia]|nr:MAG: hypothetical protein M1831_003106 [Alyxoria varia]